MRFARFDNWVVQLPIVQYLLWLLRYLFYDHPAKNRFKAQSLSRYQFNLI